METIKFDLSRNDGKFKIMHAVNNGPVHKRHAKDQWSSNMETYMELKIPYARNHDAAFCATYGGEHTVDISAIFPDFDADPYNPDSYDFVCTDEYTLVTLDAGTETFFRLGQKIEHYIKKFNIFPPKDFQKWAVICEHIIRHYNEGWANGYNLNIKYWEIWNEPDLDRDDVAYKRTWAGKKAQFFDLFEVAAKHLKKCFPDLKIGGPSLAGDMIWADEFLDEMKKREVPMDFFSWHIYTSTPEHLVSRGLKAKELLDKHGYGDAESILNEWNYIRGWTDLFRYSKEQIIDVKGATFVLSCMTMSQHAPIDMLMYYDARPSVFNGIWDMYFYDKLPSWYSFKWFSDLYDLDHEVIAENCAENIYTLCGVSQDGKASVVVTHYNEDDEAQPREVEIDLGRAGKYDIYLLDKEHSGELVKTTGELKFTMPVHSAVMIKEK